MVPVTPSPTAPPPMPMQQQPAAAQMMPQPQPPRAASRTPWGLIAAIGGGVLVVGIVLAFLFLRKDPTPTPVPPKTVNVDPAKTEPAKPTTPTTPTTPAKTVGGTAMKLLSQGSFGARPGALVAYGSYLAYGTDNSAAFIKFDAKGQAKEMARLTVKDPVGKLLAVAAGDMYNDGKAYMLALFETKLYILAEQGGVLKEIDVDGVENVFIGDYDGDGKTETVYMGLDEQGAYSFEVWRYPGNQAQYAKKGRKDPWPELFQTEMKAGTTSLLMGYTFENNALSLLLYKWDGLGGPAVIGSYPLENKADAPPEWIASGPSGFGPTLAVGRSGAKPSVEILTVASDAKSAKSLGRFDSDGTGRSAVMPGKFTGQNSQILTIDEAGSYWLYDIGK